MNLNTLAYLLIMFCVGYLEGVPVSESSIEQSKYLYKVLTKDRWVESQNKERLILGPIDDDFIHFSEEHQLDHVIKKFFSDDQKVVVLKIDVSLLKGRLVRESNPGGSNKYFHLYEGFIPFDAVISSEVFLSH
ncbi:MAG: hypothetical protein ACI8RA_003027 [Chlamydiales bacterium]|jgi:uncharacterized protein (DUF952 family)